VLQISNIDECDARQGAPRQCQGDCGAKTKRKANKSRNQKRQRNAKCATNEKLPHAHTKALRQR